MKASVLLGGVAAALAASGAISIWACDDQPRSHILIARQFDPTNTCVDPSTSVDVVDGPTPPGPCAPVCILDTNGNYFVTQMCPPYPPLDTVSPTIADGGPDPTCTQAIAVYNCNFTCDVDASADGGMFEAGCTGMPAGDGGAAMESGGASDTGAAGDSGSPEAATADSGAADSGKTDAAPE